ncbi:MAG: hypothetical protein LBL46_00945 [Rickettsiales bacterium]|jgi:hypothetical protein|nr:hypothetical protein [Rickettsiales bacterium]
MKNSLKDIAIKLNSDRFAGKAFSLGHLWSFRAAPARKLSDYNYSVGAHAFFALAAWDRLLINKIRLNGGPVKIQIESGLRDPAKQLADYDAWQVQCDADATLDRSRFVNPRVKPSPHSAGIAIDDTIADAPHLKDLLKFSRDPNANDWLPDGDQLRIKNSYFLKFMHEDWYNDIVDYMIANAAPDLSDAEKIKRAEEEPAKKTGQMHISSHAILTNEGAADRDAHIALANNNALIAMHSALPMWTPTNDEIFHGQVRRFVGDVEVRQMPITAQDCERQDPVDNAELTDEILALVDVHWTGPIYYQTTLVPGNRIDWWSDKSRNNAPTPTGGSDYLIERLSLIESARDRALEKFTR